MNILFKSDGLRPSRVQLKLFELGQTHCSYAKLVYSSQPSKFTW